MTKQARTPGPWTIRGPEQACEAFDSDGAPVLEGYGPAVLHAVACVNSHPDLKNELETIAGWIDTTFTREVRKSIPDWFERREAIRKVLAKARGQS